MSIFIMVVSGALFLFYIHTICARALRHEFSHPYSEPILNALQLEYPLVREAFDSNSSANYPQARHTLECDFVTLEYLLRNGDGTRRHLSRQEKILFLYFRLLLFCLPVLSALKVREKEVVLKLATLLQHFANRVGERWEVGAFEIAPASRES
jgi:hypothetical protein